VNIAGLVVCVGDRYATMLHKPLRIWIKTLDSLTIVTDHDTKIFSEFHENCVCASANIFRTDLFTAHGASFNKGAALSAGFAHANPQDWVLNFDADIIPPRDWREKVEPLVRPGKLLGSSRRYGEDGSLIPDADFPNIWGFFHLWHVDDPHSWRRPVFDSTCGHAGNYDHSFMMQWPESERVDVWPEIKLIHQGPPRQQWFGRDPGNLKKMRNLFMLGLYEAWQLKAGHIKPPEPYKICIDFGPPGWVYEMLSDYTTKDPFLYQVRVGDDPKQDEEFVRCESS
jgi:hypothetical protein